MQPGLVDIIDASYQLDGDTEMWMTRVGGAVDAHLGYGLGLIATRYRIGEGNEFHELSMIPVNMPPASVAVIRRAMERLTPQYVAATYSSVPCAMVRTIGPTEVKILTELSFREHFEPNGWNDCLAINGLDPTRQGLALGVWLPQRHRITAEFRQRWSRVAAHIAAGHRLRNQLGNRASSGVVSGAEAILTARGRVEHATDAAKSVQARQLLTEGIRAIVRSREKIGRRDPDLALAERKALVAARWTLIDHFESDGKHYVLAQRNEAMMTGFEMLTTREKQALGFASLGHSNKLIAYEMGIAAPTVAVLLGRAARKLGTHSRSDLLETYVRLSAPDSAIAASR